MIDRIIRFSIDQKLIIGLLVMTLIGWGTYNLLHLPIDAVPDITDNQVQVITNSPSLAAQEVEQLITYPLEMTLANLPDLVEIRSISRFGLSVITVVFEDHVDIYKARQLISERLKIAESEIPPELGTPELGPITTGLGEVYQYVLHPAPGYDTVYDAMELRSIQDWIVKRQLAGVPGVIEVNSSGGYLKQYEVAFDPERLRSMNVTVNGLFDALEHNNENTGGSYIEKDQYTYFIRGEGRVESIREIENIVVDTRNGAPLLVKDIAKVQFGHAPRFGAMTMNGEGELVGGQVMMLKGANSAEVTKAVKDRIEEIKESLPEGVILEPYLDREKLINKTIHTVEKNLIEGGLIVIFILVLLLGNLRAGLVVASVIPLSMLFAVSMMRVFGVSANLMSLGAIDFGLIVDGAVIIVEAIVHRLQVQHPGQKLSRIEMDNAVYDASVRIRKSAAFGEIIILIVYIPILSLSGIEGKMFKPMAQTVSFAIIGALLMSLTYVPMMSALILPKISSTKKTIADRIMNFFEALYSPVIRFALEFRSVFVSAALVLFLFSLFLFSRMGGEFIPTLEEGDFALHQILPPGSSLEEGVKVSAELQNILLENFPEVEKVVTKIGTAEIPTDIMPLEAGDIYVIMKDRSEWTSASTREEMFIKMEEKLSEFPGVMYEFTQPIQMRFNELMTGVRQDIAIKIYGEDLGLLHKLGNQTKEIINRIGGVGDIQVEQISGLQQMVVDYDRSRIAEYGLHIAELNSIIRTAFAGEVAGFVLEGEKRFDLVLRLEGESREGIDDLINLYVNLPGGGQISLDQVADIQFVEGPTQISRDNTKRRIVIGVNARNRDVQSLVEEIQNELKQQLDLPVGYYVTYGGQFENLIQARQRLMIAVPVALLLIFVLLHITFGSFAQASLIFTAIPLAATGGIFALQLRGMPFSISAGVGFIALFGVAVLNGIVLIAYFNELKNEGMTDIKERILKGTRVRLRPVVMTAAVASLGFLPMALSRTAGAEVQRPLATVVIGGLITATFLTLVVLPVLYYWMERFLERRKVRTKGAAVITVLLMLGSGFSVQAQNPTSLADVMNTATANHPLLNAADLQVKQQEALQKTAFNMAPTQFFWSVEETPGAPIDGIQSFAFSQQIEFPALSFARRKELLARTDLAEAEREKLIAIVQNDIVSSYAKWQYASALSNFYRKQDSLYSSMASVARIQWEAGSISKLEYEQIESGSGMMEVLLMQARQDSLREISVLSLYTNGNIEDWIPDPQWELSPLKITADTAWSHSPDLGISEGHLELSKKQLTKNKWTLAPSISGSFGVQQLQGESGFIRYQVGTGIPLWFRPQQGRIQASRYEMLAMEEQYNWTEWQMQKQVIEAMANAERSRTSLDWWNETGTRLALKQIDGAIESFKLGEIDALQMLQILQQQYKSLQNAIEQRLEYNLNMNNLYYLSGNTPQF